MYFLIYPGVCPFFIRVLAPFNGGYLETHSLLYQECLLLNFNCILGRIGDTYFFKKTKCMLLRALCTAVSNSHICVFTKIKITKCYFRFEVHFITIYSILDIDLVQFSFEQHVFALRRSTYTWNFFFFNKYVLQYYRNVG